MWFRLVNRPIPCGSLVVMNDPIRIVIITCAACAGGVFGLRFGKKAFALRF